jgi:glycolate oxidase FAD binding subunit
LSATGGHTTGHLHPGGAAELAVMLRQVAADRQALRITGRGTKLGWGAVNHAPQRRLQTVGLERTLALDPDAATATFEAGVPLARAQAELSRVRLMLALDPPLGTGGHATATLGGVLATGDTGPLSHRHGGGADQVLALTVVTGDGQVVEAARDKPSGAELIALQIGAYGTLGVIVNVTVRLHPLPAQSATAFGATSDPAALHTATAALDRSRGDLDGLDFAWRAGRGGLLARCGGSDCHERAAAAATAMRAHGLEDASVRADDNTLWARQRAGQRARNGAVVRVSALPAALPELLALSDELGATAVGRAALATAYLTLDVNKVAPLRAGLPAGASAIVLDLPAPARGAVDLWGPVSPPLLARMRTLKARFDPNGVCNPGVFVGGI